MAVISIDEKRVIDTPHFVGAQKKNKKQKTTNLVQNHFPTLYYHLQHFSFIYVANNHEGLAAV